MTGLPVSVVQIAILLLFAVFSLGGMWLIGRKMRAEITEQPGTTRRTELSQEAINAIVGRGLATAVQLFQMSAAEQRVLAQTALALVTATQLIPGGVADVGAPATFCPQCGKAIGNFPAEIPWRCTCEGCGSAIVLRRDGVRLVLSYTPRS